MNIMGVYKFSTGKIEIENSDMDWFVVPKSVSFSYNNTKSTNQSSKLYFFVDGKAEISISNQSNTDLLFSGTSENVKLKLSNPNVGSISIVGNQLKVDVSSYSSGSQLNEINMYSGSISFSGSGRNNLNGIVVHVPNGLESDNFIKGLDSSQYTLVYDLVYIADNVNYLEIVDKYNKLKSELSKVKSLILLNNDNEIQDLLFVKLLLLNKEITNTKKQIYEYEDAIDF